MLYHGLASPDALLEMHWWHIHLLSSVAMKVGDLRALSVSLQQARATCSWVHPLFLFGMSTTNNSMSKRLLQVSRKGGEWNGAYNIHAHVLMHPEHPLYVHWHTNTSEHTTFND